VEVRKLIAQIIFLDKEGLNMDDEVKAVKVEGLPTTRNGSLKVELVPMPSVDDPWRTKADYLKEQRRDTTRFLITIASLILSIIGVAATAVVAVAAVKSVSQQAIKSMTTDPNMQK